MKNFDFNPIGNESLTITFNCANCSEKLSADINIPAPNYSGDTTETSQVEEEETITCDNSDCEEVYTISICSSITGGSGNIEELDEDSEITIDENSGSESLNEQ